MNSRNLLEELQALRTDFRALEMENRRLKAELDERDRDEWKAQRDTTQYKCELCHDNGWYIVDPSAVYKISTPCDCRTEIS